MRNRKCLDLLGYTNGNGTLVPLCLSPCHAGSSRGFGDGFGDGGADAVVEGLGDDIVLRELALGDELRQRVRGGDLHFLVDIAGAYVKCAAEDAREGQNVVDLVRVIAPAGRDDLRAARLRVLREDLRRRVRAGEDDRILVQVLTISVVTVPGALTPMNTSAPTSMSARLPALRSRFVTSAISSLIQLRPSRPL